MNKQNLPDPDDMFADTRMSMGDHLEELRHHLLRAIYGFAIGLLVSFFIGQWVMRNVISKPVEEQLYYYWERYNDRQLGPLVDRYTKERTLKLPRIPVNKKEFAAHFETVDRNGEKGRLIPRDGPLFDPTGGFRKMLEMEGGLDQLVDKKKAGDDDLIYLEPDAREFIKAMTDFNLAAKPPTLAAMAPQEAFVVFLKVCMLTGLILTSPWVFYQIWTFVAAGLYPHEKRLVNLYLPYSIVLFLLGAFVCQFLVLPKAIAGLLWFNDWLEVQPDFRLNEWLSFAILMPLVFGVSFQTPLVMLFVYSIGAVQIESFRKFRGIAYFIIAVFAAIILPTPDALSMMMLAGPMWLLYEAGIFLCKMQPRIEYQDSDSEHDMIEV